jgi:hypothetical protein
VYIQAVKDFKIFFSIIILNKAIRCSEKLVHETLIQKIEEREICDKFRSLANEVYIVIGGLLGFGNVSVYYCQKDEIPCSGRRFKNTLLCKMYVALRIEGNLLLVCRNIFGFSKTLFLKQCLGDRWLHYFV